jgi:hypothetical protein
MITGLTHELRSPRVALSWWGAIDGTTIGDLYALENVSNALTQRDVAHVVLSRFPVRVHAPVVGDPSLLSQVVDQIVHVCGPLVDHPKMRFILSRGRRRTAVGVSVLEHAETINRMFQTIVARDGLAPETFDLALARYKETSMPAPKARAATVEAAICLRGGQGEYAGRRVLHERAEQLFLDSLKSRGATVRTVHTQLRSGNPESGILASFAEADVIVTTRMHGALFALASGTPVVALDQIAGGAKVSSVLTRTGWPLVFNADSVSPSDIDRALDAALSPEILPVVERCRADAIRRSVAALEASVEAIVRVDKGP